ncbi:MAG: dephospho-CoA kinase [Pseudomonadota bacterium]
MTFRLGLTGSIGMGKSTTAAMFADFGCDLWDADAAVHRLYAQGGAAVAPVSAVFPGALVDGAINRAALRDIVTGTSDALNTLESIVHPLVAQDRAEFVVTATADIIVFDIPLLFETGAEHGMDAVACVTVDPAIQRERVLARGKMSAEQFEHILSKQMSNAEKCKRADFVIVTDTLDHARQQVQTVVADIRAGLSDA